MIEIIEKIISNFISLLILLTILFYVSKKFHKIQKILILFILIIFFSPIANILVYSVERLNKTNDISNIESNFDNIVILSGHEEIHKTDKFDQIYLGGSNNRIIEGARIHFKYKKKIIFSGSSAATNSHLSGTLVAEKFFKSFNINDESIIFDKDAKNTEDTFKFLNKHFKYEKHLIVTSALHILRCKLLADKYKLNYILYPVDYRANHENIYNLNFSIRDNIYLFHYGLREIAALIFYKLSNKI